MMIDLNVGDSNICAIEMYKHFTSESIPDEGDHDHGLIQSYADCNNFERKSRTKFKLDKILSKEVEINGRKKIQTTKQNSNIDVSIEKSNESPIIESSLFECIFPKHMEGEFAAAIFEIGLKNSSPKVLMGLMPSYSTLTTEHIKSHLQKYRIHNDRSKEEFLEFYERYIREPFQNFENDREWEKPIRKRKLLPNSIIEEEINFHKVLKLCPSSVIDTVESGVIDWVGQFEKVISDHQVVIESLKCVANGEIPSRYLAEHTAAQQLESLVNALPDDSLSLSTDTSFDNLFTSSDFSRTLNSDPDPDTVATTNTTTATASHTSAAKPLPPLPPPSNSNSHGNATPMILTSESLNSSNRIRALASFYTNNTISCSHLANNPLETIYGSSNYNNNINNVINNNNNNYSSSSSSSQFDHHHHHNRQPLLLSPPPSPFTNQYQQQHQYVSNNIPSIATAATSSSPSPEGTTTASTDTDPSYSSIDHLYHSSRPVKQESLIR